MMALILGLVIFFAAHVLPTNTQLRDGLVARFGASAYKAGFSIISLAGLVVIVLGYYKMQHLYPGKNPILYDPPLFMRHITLALMLPAMILLVASQIPSRIRTAVGHPMLAAVKIWAFAHLLANGDGASVLLFGSFLAYAVYDRISVKKRGARGPLGDKAPTGILNDVLVVVIGAVLYAALLHGGHAWLFGVAPLPGV